MGVAPRESAMADVNIGLYTGNGTSRMVHNGSRAIDIFYSKI